MSSLLLHIQRHSNKALQVNDNSSVAQSTNVSSQNQWWNILPVEDFYKITNKETGLALEVNQSEYDNGASIISSSFSSEDNQLWSIVDLGNGYYELLNKYSLKAVDIASASMNEGATAIQYTFEGSENQQFLLSSILTNTTENNSLTNTFFPNPFEKNILVRTTLPLQYVIVDVLGNTIESGNCQENCMVGEMLQTGVYTLILKEEGMIYRSIKLVKK